MPAPRKPNKGKSGKKDLSPSVLESEKSILRERQRQIDEKIAALNRTIKAATVPGYRIDTTLAKPGAGAVPVDKRYNEKRRPPKKVVLRAEKQEGRLQTLALVVVVIALVLYAVYKFT